MVFGAILLGCASGLVSAGYHWMRHPVGAVRTMAAWLLIALQAFESGFWLGQVGYRRRQRAKVRARLVWGRQPSTRLPVIDEHLRKTVGTPTTTQIRVANGIVHVARWLIHTRAFELVVLKAVRGRWPNRPRLNAHVRGRG